MGSGYTAISMCTMALQVLRQWLARRTYTSLLKTSWNSVKRDLMKGITTCLNLIWRILKQQLGKNSITRSCKSRRPEWKYPWAGQARHVVVDNHKGEKGHNFLSRRNIIPALQEHGLSIVHPYLGSILEGGRREPAPSPIEA